MTRSRPPSAGLGPGRWTVLGALILLCLPPGAAAQVRDRDARIPGSGEVWIELAPQWTSWSRQFGAGGADPSDGRTEPLFADYDGPVADRLFPGLDPLLDAVNRDAGDLGFVPLTAGEVEMGSTDFGSIDVFERTIPLSVQVGLGGFAALEVLVPIVKTEVESGFTFDSTTAGLVRAETAIVDAATFFSGLDAAQSELRALIDGGTLSQQDSSAAEALLSDTEAFEGALSSRISDQAYLFTSGSTSGQQISAYYASFESGFQTYGITAPSFALTDSAVRQDFDAYLQREPLLGQPLADVVRGYSIGEIEIGARFKVLDTFGWPSRPPEAEEPSPQPSPLAPPEPADTAGEAGIRDSADVAPVRDSTRAAAPRDSTDAATPPDSAGAALPADSARGGAPAAVPVPRDTAVTGDEAGGLRFRTTVGVRYRLALSDPDEDPYLVPGVFLQQPIGDGQPDVQLELYQDVALGPRFWIVAGATYGLQLADELVRRVSPPDQPYAAASQQVTVRRDLGDYLRIVASPRFRIVEPLSLALEYTYWNKGSDTYETVDGGVDATPLALRTGQSRHTLGIGAYYRTTRMFAAGRSSLPVDVALLWETAIGGSGGRTPSSSVVTVSVRVPFLLF